ncbi:MAG: hypothetical protein PF483_06525 [Halothiobacillus sp.]|uniref:hypothetical protein n=1 Tax=Halothiobacillus sp. TaxID=1891311 RepID=UPI002AD4C707|nr:hypothetical protein [Halothiobacillus sp.]MDA3876725.1 hypothetical protein [Halothiobacillus sp.]
MNAMQQLPPHRKSHEQATKYGAITYTIGSLAERYFLSRETRQNDATWWFSGYRTRIHGQDADE